MPLQSPPPVAACVVRRVRREALAAVVVLATTAGPVLAQLDLGGAPLAGGDEHWYRRTRGLLETSAPDPWAHRLTPRLPEHGWRVRWLRPEVRLLFNSLRPSDGDDGVVWAGRGLTGAAQGGVEARWGIVHLQVAPIVFRSQNRAFPLVDNGQTGPLRYGDAQFPGSIDLPQRFGDDPYGRADAGDSFLALEWRGATLGLSSARQLWGPAREFPLVLGTHAGGFPHAFLGTTRPLSVGIGTVEARLIAARLEQSAWSPVQQGENRRFHSGLTVTFRPRGVPWLAVGGNRTETSPWPAGGPTLAQALGPFNGIMNAGNTSSLQTSGSNGFASAFTRVAVPGSGLEIYGELSWEDFANDIRRFLQKPDDLNTVTIGLGRAWGDSPDALHWLGVELTNGEVAHQERGQRGFVTPFPPYTHSPTVQGLTSRGQLLGSLATFRGSAAIATYERYTPRGRARFQVRRELLLNALPTQTTPQVALTGSAAVTRFIGQREWSVELSPTYLSGAAEDPTGGAFGLSVSLRWRGF
ncbi:MAG: hypothetical protein RL139_852 [Gemmatimonadota bacterium]